MHEKKFKVVVYYERWSDEDSERGATDDSGIEFEGTDTLKSIVYDAKRLNVDARDGYNPDSQYDATGSPWKSSYFEPGTRDEFESGKDTYYSMFVTNTDGSGLSVADFNKINTALGGRAVKANCGPRRNPSLRGKLKKFRHAMVGMTAKEKRAARDAFAALPKAEQKRLSKQSRDRVLEEWHAAGDKASIAYDLRMIRKGKDPDVERAKSTKSIRERMRPGLAPTYDNPRMHHARAMNLFHEAYGAHLKGKATNSEIKRRWKAARNSGYGSHDLWEVANDIAYNQGADRWPLSLGGFLGEFKLFSDVKTDKWATETKASKAASAKKKKTATKKKKGATKKKTSASKRKKTATKRRK